MRLVLAPEDVLVRGFRTIKGLPAISEQQYDQRNIETFKEHFGPSPCVVASVWNDMCTHLLLGAKDRSERGFKMVLTALHFLWAYPRNAAILASTCGVCKRNVQGEALWKWVRLVSDLKSRKIIWPEGRYNDPNGQKFLASVDGTDYKTREISTEEYNMDRRTFSQKFNHCAVKYEIGIDCYLPKIVWTNGPFRGGEHDKNIFNEGLRDKIPAGKKVIVDRVYGNKKVQGANDVFAMPNLCDSKHLGNFKSRCRARHEGLNGRLKAFKALDATFRHDVENKHEIVFDAVITLVQYEIDHGVPIFDA